ncbi:MAG TPA: ABC transporter ATP-binding protein [Ktedonosporobacter sp.]|nr:ABC transporter ATP-binding protein [Ktedonosporobacter sp.]
MNTYAFEQERPTIITTTGLTKKFGKLVAVNDLHLEVRQGDVFGFLGPNGSGKTTTIRMLLGLLRPSAGSAQIFGLDNRAHLQEILPRIGGIIEAPVYYSYLSGRENLQVFAMVSGMRDSAKTRRRIDEVLELVDLTRQAKDACRKYSLGMKQRLAIGMALLTDPELVLLDEPTNGLDPVGVHEIRQMILRLAAAGKTVILSSHLLYEVQQVCNHVAILQKGNMIKQGEVRDLLQNGARLLVRMNTAIEAQAALSCLLTVRGMDWITQIDVHDTTLEISAPSTKASEIVALLASQHLYLAELRPLQASLEEFFIQLVGEENTAGMAALVG